MCRMAAPTARAGAMPPAVAPRPVELRIKAAAAPLPTTAVRRAKPVARATPATTAPSVGQVVVKLVARQELLAVRVILAPLVAVASVANAWRAAIPVVAPSARARAVLAPIAALRVMVAAMAPAPRATFAKVAAGAEPARLVARPTKHVVRIVRATLACASASVVAPTAGRAAAPKDRIAARVAALAPRAPWASLARLASARPSRYAEPKETLAARAAAPPASAGA